MTLTQDIRYLGVNDRDIDLFEGQYAVPNGISYNSYVILDEKVAVLDTVDHRKSEEFLANLERELAGREEARIEEKRASAQKEADDVVRRLYEEYELTRSEAEATVRPAEDVPAAAA